MTWGLTTVLTIVLGHDGGVKVPQHKRWPNNNVGPSGAIAVLRSMTKIVVQGDQIGNSDGDQLLSVTTVLSGLYRYLVHSRLNAFYSSSPYENVIA